MRKYILILSGLVLALLVLALLSFPDRNLHVVFCDVGQGDGILVSYGTTQILVDGGPDASVVGCLSRHMPFWDRRVEVLVATHPQLDHFAGFIDVLKLYRVEIFASPEIPGNSLEWRELMREIGEMRVQDKKLSKDAKLRYRDLYFDILHPPEGFFGGDLNEYSIVGNLSFGEFDVLLTGDIIPSVIPVFLEQVEPVEVLKVPHHGSKNGLTRELLEKSLPQLAVISVGKNNRFGHPHEEILGLIREMGGIRVMRTDLDGEIEVVSDGKKWWVELD